MVKFSKQFEGHLVPEWKEAFVDYWQLKKDLKRLNQSNNDNRSHTKSFTDLVFSCFKNRRKGEHGIIRVCRKFGDGDLYETELLEQSAVMDAATEFFTRLDFQLNKVNQFYKTKEREFLERGDTLKRQMEILLVLKNELIKQKQPKGKSSNEDDSVSSGTILYDEDQSMRDSMDAEEELENLSTDELDQCEVGKSIGTKKDERRVMPLSEQLLHCKGKSFRIHIPLTNPVRTLSALSYLLCDELGNQFSRKCDLDGKKLCVDKKKLHCAEKIIRGAFVELYKGLGYLKTYRNLNMLAFAKILKKFDKVTYKQVLPIYLGVVERSYFNTSDKALKLADEVEQLFVRHFAADDRRKAMKYLKPTKKKESHMVIFFTGLFTGCFLALFLGYIITACNTGMYRSESDVMYMETVYPVLSIFSLMFLHFFLYGCNIVMWRKVRINYSFIFELSPTKELKHSDVFLICATSMVAVMGILFVHLTLVSKGFSFAQVKGIPGLLLLSFILVLVCPFNIIYKSSRFRFLSIIRNIILSPLYKVVMLDFFMADQLCSQVPLLREMEYIACYYITGSYKTQDYLCCMRNTYYRDLAYAVSFLPYYWRAMQCARRWFDEGDTGHLTNLGKYVSAMLAAGAKVAYEKEKGAGWLYLFVFMSSIATLYQLYWDFVKDWGLLQFHSKNPWLRDELMLPQKFIYFVSMGLNLILRLAWLQTVFHYNFEKVDYRVTMLFLAALEVVRRGQWNFYRLENEHLNNADKFRAVKTVPLPFHEVDEQD